jgi:hypothetical protein
MDLKRCSKCKLWLSLDNFALDNSRKDKLNPYCRACIAGYGRARYARNGRPPSSRVGQAAAYVRNSRYLWDYLLEHPCVDCGEADPMVLDFDHVRGEKLMAVSRCATQGFSLTRLAAEIAKCDVRCANCHRRITARKRNYYGLIGRNVPAVEDELGETA